MGENSISNTLSVNSIINNLNKSAAKRAERKENIMLTFIIRATIRDQEKRITISKLRREVKDYTDKISLLEMENKALEKQLYERDKQLEELKNEKRTLNALLIQSERKSSTDDHICNDNDNNNNNHYKIISPEKHNYNNEDFEVVSITDVLSYKKSNAVVSTFSNIVASPKNEAVTIDHHMVGSTTSEDQIAEVPKLKRTKLRRSSRKTQDSHLSSIVHNLRKRVKISKESKQQ